MNGLIVYWITPEEFALWYQIVGALMAASGLWLSSMLPHLSLNGLPRFVMLSIAMICVGMVLLGVGLFFKVHGTYFGEWLLISGDSSLVMGLFSLTLSVRSGLRFSK